MPLSSCSRAPHPGLSNLLVWLLVLVTGTSASAATDDARLAALEKRIDELALENKALRQQLGTIAGKGDAAFARAAGKESKFVIGGFLQANAESGDAPDARFTGIADRFLLRRMRINFAALFTEQVAFKVEADFGGNSISPRTGLNGQLTDAYAAWTKYPAAHVRLGQFKTPFGFEQLVSDTKTFMIERSLSNDRLTVGRQVGAMLGGDLAGNRLSYSLGVFNGTGTNTSSNDNEKFMTSGRLGVVAHEGRHHDLPVKLSVATNFFSTVDKGAFIGRRTGYGADAQLVVGPGEFHAEWLRNDLHPVTGRATQAEGWALLSVWNVTKRWQTAVRFESYDSNAALPNTTTDTWTFGVNYLLKGDDLKLSLNYLAGRQPPPARDGGRFLGRMQVVF